MDCQITHVSACQCDGDAIVVAIFADGVLEGAAAEVNEATGGVLSQLYETQELKGSHGEVTTILAPAGVQARQIVVVGLGDRETLQRGCVFKAAGAAARRLAEKPRRSVAFYFEAEIAADFCADGVAGAIVGCVGQDLYRADKTRHPFESIFWCGGTEDDVRAGQIMGDSVNLTRRLVNEPASEIYPISFATACETLASETGLEIEVWDQKRLEQERCGALLGVSQGSAQPPRLVILKHQGGKKEDAPLALVGKGVTFDSGGLSLKPSDGMKAMKCDMAGAATVVGAMHAIALEKVPVNVIGLVGLVENMVSGASYKLGDVLTARNGKTIEVLNTDAEGRLVLADVLDVAIEQGADRIVDLATLTGACLVALGTDVAGLMTNNQGWCEQIADAAQNVGEAAWQLPMFREYGEQIKSQVADIKNIGEGRWGGAITAAKFLEEFVGETAWVHMDIAGPAFSEKPKAWVDAGGSGAFVRTLVEVAKKS